MYEIIYKDLEDNKNYEDIIEKVLNRCYLEENLDKEKLIITVTLTTPKNIKDINNQFRGIDKETDVLSFPMFEKEEIDEKLVNNKLSHEEILGDIIVSIERVKKQAKEYNHSFERELSYMIVHGFYHLMGYDHIEENDKIIMRKKEDVILNDLRITRE